MNATLENNFACMFKDNQRIIHKVCRIYTNNDDDHKDLFQEIVLQLWNSFPKFRGEAKVSTWMYRIALNTAITQIRRPQKKQILHSEIDVSLMKIQTDEEDYLEEDLEKMYTAIHQLTDIEKALIMMYLEDNSYKEIADVLGITEGNARVKMNKAKNSLKEIIKKI